MQLARMLVSLNFEELKDIAASVGCFLNARCARPGLELLKKRVVQGFFFFQAALLPACLSGCITTQPSRQPATMTSHQAPEAPS